jgi:hypothetical protein
MESAENLDITISSKQVTEIFKATNGITELLKRLPCRPEDAPVKYAIVSNLAAIQLSLTAHNSRWSRA